MTELFWDLRDEVRRRDEGETTPPLLHGAQHCEGTQRQWFWEHPSEHCDMDGDIPHWAGGEAPASGFMDIGYRQISRGFERKDGLMLGGTCIDQLRSKMAGSPLRISRNHRV